MIWAAEPPCYFSIADGAFAVGAVYYNDEAGIRAMAGTVAWERRLPILSDSAAVLVTIELRDESGRMLPGLIVGDRWFVVGEEGRHYSIVVRNRTDLRLEVVLSVDGLDVIDGRTASFRKRGHIVNPHRKLVVEGFRQSTEAVAAFRFGPVRESYAAEKYHNPVMSASSASLSSMKQARIFGPMRKCVAA
jgi:hypothetical protein